MGVLRNAAARRAAFDAAAARGRTLVLVHHRVTPGGALPHEVVPSLAGGVLERQLEILGEVGDIVPAVELAVARRPRRRIGFAITFDDDYATHVDHALPLLRRYGVHATFFLSGRSLRGCGAYWWMRLERLIARHGLAETGRLLGVAASTPSRMAEACERLALSERIASLEPATESETELLDARGMRALADAGMAIGFHTLHHPVLTGLPDAELDRALTDGRAELAEAVRRPMQLVAYPHGRADRRVADHARAAGYLAAFATGGRPIGRGSERFLLGRWDPAALVGDELLAHLALRLNRPAGAP
ncbi:MAG TPA: polysaccharide deacetylase family protein [Gemmatimonadaceae bacterium]